MESAFALAGVALSLLTLDPVRYERFLSALSSLALMTASVIVTIVLLGVVVGRKDGFGSDAPEDPTFLELG